MDVAIRELKAKLSSYLKRAEAGEIITVTDRGRPVAMLSPVSNAVELDAAVAAGWVTPASARALRPTRRYPSESSIEQVLAEDRAE
jgi:prevent-host-death family protein